MARNGSGTFTRLSDFTDDAAADINIEASRVDAELDGFADEITNSLPRDGQAAMTDDLPMGSNKITGLAAGTADGDAVNMTQYNAIAITGQTLLNVVFNSQVFGRF